MNTLQLRSLKFFIACTSVILLVGCQTSGGIRPNLLNMTSSTSSVIQPTPDTVVEKYGMKETVKRGDCRRTHKEVVAVLDKLEKNPKEKVDAIKAFDGINIYCEFKGSINFGEEGVTPTGLIAKRLCDAQETNPEKFIPLLEQLHSMGDNPSKVVVNKSVFQADGINYKSLMDEYIGCSVIKSDNKESYFRSLAAQDLEQSKVVWRHIVKTRGKSVLSVDKFKSVTDKNLLKELVPLMGDLNRQVSVTGTMTNTILGAALFPDGFNSEESADPAKVEVLLDAGADPNLTYGITSQPPLHYLLTEFSIPIENKLKSAQLLLDYGADPNIEYQLPIAGLQLREPLPFYHLAHTYVLGGFNGINGGGYPGEKKDYGYTASTEEHMRVLKFAVEEAGMEYDRDTLKNTLVPIWRAMATNSPAHDFRRELLKPERVNRRIDELLKVF